MVGSGWVVIVGVWLENAGPLGAALGFLGGTVTMMAVALCYGELASRFGEAGGEFLYALNAFGRGPAFFVGWFLTLFAIAVCAFEAVVLGSLFRSLLPMAAGPVLYRIGGSPIDVASLVLGLGGAVVIGALHSRGAASAIRFQKFVTLGFLALVVFLVLTGLVMGDPRNLIPLFRSRPGSSWPLGSLSVFAMSAFFLNGWQAALHAIEERRADVSVERATRAILLGIAVAGLVYTGIVIVTAGAAPWHLLRDSPMPVRTGFDILIPGWHLGAVVILAACVSVAKTWSATLWLGSRLILAQARAGFLPRRVATVEGATGAPRRAIWAVSGLSFLGPLCGRAAVTPIVTMVAICLALSIVVSLLALLRLRRFETTSVVHPVPGGRPTIVFALGAALVMVATGIMSPFLDDPNHFPLEWRLLVGWGGLGWLVYRWQRSLGTSNTE
jgi:amino acid transporter